MFLYINLPTRYVFTHQCLFVLGTDILVIKDSTIFQNVMNVIKAQLKSFFFPSPLLAP